MSELKTTLKADMVAAMKARDDLTKGTLRMVLAAITTAEVAGDEARELGDDEVLALLTREVRTRKDSAQAYTDGGRPELADKELAEVGVLQRYLPADLTSDELATMVAEEVASAEAGLGQKPTMKQMGQIVRAVNERAAGRAEGGEVARLVRQALA
ncbi:GatB/YqeY domain-containing protein [Aestuariimicrobium kwangyangense]|uniref:GatB/YqeY domain-containing protein n=1 Tax=Aestuariimicrobium kwangyangense TaxID=396389 RepID=UPI0003B64507|nr:GatB/YqeY domain-containing protein [Aestuariimicrobium kwangyangense]